MSQLASSCCPGGTWDSHVSCVIPANPMEIPGIEQGSCTVYRQINNCQVFLKVFALGFFGFSLHKFALRKEMAVS